MGIETGFEYTIRIPYNKGENMVLKYDKLCIGYEGPTIKVKCVSDFFKALDLYFGTYEMSVCPTNFDLVVKGKFWAAEYANFFETYSDVAEFARDFQIVDKEYGGYPFYNKYTQQILRNKNNKFYRINITKKGKIHEWQSKTEKYTLDELKDNYCDEGKEDAQKIKAMTDDEIKALRKRVDEIYFTGINKNDIKKARRMEKESKIDDKTEKMITEMAKKIAFEHYYIPLLRTNETLIQQLEEFLKNELSTIEDSIAQNNKRDYSEDEDEDEGEDEYDVYEDLCNDVDVESLVRILLGGLLDRVSDESVDLFDGDDVRDLKIVLADCIFELYTEKQSKGL
jgi:hypothetical protein